MNIINGLNLFKKFLMVFMEVDIQEQLKGFKMSDLNKIQISKAKLSYKVKDQSQNKMVKRAQQKVKQINENNSCKCY